MSDGKLTGAQKSFLRGLAQTMDASIKVGKSGVSDSLVRELDLVLDANEITKLRFLSADRLEQDTLVAEIETRGRCTLAGQVGRTAVFYRQNPTAEKRRITLP